MTPAERILKLRAERKKSWISQEIHVCPGCGMKFRHRINLNNHLKVCIDYKYGKQED